MAVMAGALAFTLDSEVTGHILGIAEMWTGQMQGRGTVHALTACLCTALHLHVTHCHSGVQHGARDLLPRETTRGAVLSSPIGLFH